MANRLFRFENQFVLGAAAATEGFYFYISEDAPVDRVSDAVRELVAGWFIEPNPTSGVSRADLMPISARFETSKLFSFALDLLEIESELYSAFLSIPAARDREPLPAIVSKEVEIHGDDGGRGRFNRIHTSFHPLDAVDPADSRVCSLEYQSQLVDVYLFLFNTLQSTLITWPGIHHPFADFLHPARVATPRGPSNNVLRYEVFDAVRVVSGSRRWGTMRRRGAVVHH